MFGSFDISASALTAQRVRLDTITSNIANIHSVKDEAGRNVPYRRMYPIFQAQAMSDGRTGVSVQKIEQDASDFRKAYEPWNKEIADKEGYVYYPNVNLSTEQINAIETTRAYEANITAIETTKSMMSATLRVLG